jgi:squalene monooxygenase
MYVSKLTCVWSVAGVSWNEINRRISLFQEARKSHATTINVLSFALYRVFSKPASDNGTRARLREACLEYLSLGGLYTAGPVGLLAGLTPKPAVLVAHFFAVASFAMKRALLPCPTPQRIRQGYDLLHVACIIIMPLLQNEKATFLSSNMFVTLTNILFPWKNTDIATM